MSDGSSDVCSSDLCVDGPDVVGCRGKGGHRVIKLLGKAHHGRFITRRQCEHGLFLNMGGFPSVLLAQFLLPSFSCSVPGQFLPFLMDAAAFQFAQLRIAAHSSHKLIEHLKESTAPQQDKKRSEERRVGKEGVSTYKSRW